MANALGYNGKIYPLTPGVSRKLYTVPIIIRESEWIADDSGSGYSYKYCHEIIGVTSDDTPILGLANDITISNVSRAELKSDFDKILDVVASTDMITIYANSKPTNDLILNAKQVIAARGTVNNEITSITNRLDILENNTSQLPSNSISNKVIYNSDNILVNSNFANPIINNADNVCNIKSNAIDPANFRKGEVSKIIEFADLWKATSNGEYGTNTDSKISSDINADEDGTSFTRFTIPPVAKYESSSYVDSDSDGNYDDIDFVGKHYEYNLLINYVNYKSLSYLLGKTFTISAKLRLAGLSNGINNQVSLSFGCDDSIFPPIDEDDVYNKRVSVVSSNTEGEWVTLSTTLSFPSKDELLGYLDSEVSKYNADNTYYISYQIENYINFLASNNNDKDKFIESIYPELCSIKISSINNSTDEITDNLYFDLIYAKLEEGESSTEFKPIDKITEIEVINNIYYDELGIYKVRFNSTGSMALSLVSISNTESVAFIPLDRNITFDYSKAKCPANFLEFISYLSNYDECLDGITGKPSYNKFNQMSIDNSGVGLSEEEFNSFLSSEDSKMIYKIMVSDPTKFDVVSLDSSGNITSLGNPSEIYFYLIRDNLLRLDIIHSSTESNNRFFGSNSKEGYIIIDRYGNYRLLSIISV